MDLFGHALSGVLLSQLVAPQPLPERRSEVRWMVTGAVATTFPDIDAISALGGPDVFYEWHQVWTHNVVAFAILPALVALIASRWPKPGLPLGRMFALFYSGMALHLLGDVIAYWPLKFLRPFSNEGFTFSLIRKDFSLGLVLVLLVGAGVTALPQLAKHRRIAAGTSLLAAVAFVLLGLG